MALDLHYWDFRLLAWTGGIAAMLWARGFAKSRWPQAVGIGLMSVPVWEALWGILDSISVLIDPNSVLLPYSRYQLSGLYASKILADLGYLGAGFLLYCADSWRDVGRLRIIDIARRLRNAGLPLGRRTESASAYDGLLLFPGLLFASYAINVFLNGLQSLESGDESQVFIRMTIFHAVLISLAAAFGEELVYRGFLQTVLARRLPMLAAIVLQAIFFGFAHSGYGTWTHVIVPAMFGLIAGLVAWRFGIWAAIVLHLLVDLFAFGAETGSNHPWIFGVLAVFLLANMALDIVWAVRKIWQRWPSTTV